jgi:hypothetical protein
MRIEKKKRSVGNPSADRRTNLISKQIAGVGDVRKVSWIVIAHAEAYWRLIWKR